MDLLHEHKCCHEQDVKRGSWSIEEDQKLVEHIKNNGFKKWSDVPRLAGLRRCGKSCRLRWLNYLRPGVKLGNFTEYETNRIIELHKKHKNKWAMIAKCLPGRTDNEVKNYWNTTIKKKLLRKEKRQHFGNNNGIATPAVGGDRVGSGSIITGSSANNNNGFSYSSFSEFNNLVPFSPITRPPPLPSSNNQLSIQNILQGFGPFPNPTLYNYEMHFNNANVSIPDVVIPTPTSSILQNHPQIQLTWASDNINYPLNFHQASHEESFAPFMFPDNTASIHDENNLDAYPPMNNHDSSVMMATKQEENIEINNNNNVNSSIIISDDGMDLLETMLSSYPSVLSPSSSGSTFFNNEQPQALTKTHPFGHSITSFLKILITTCSTPYIHYFDG